MFQISQLFGIRNREWLVEVCSVTERNASSFVAHVEADFHELHKGMVSTTVRESIIPLHGYVSVKGL
jgi:hypothetical protein